MKKSLIFTLVAVFSVGVIVVATGSASALVNSVKSSRDSDNSKKTSYGKHFKDDDGRGNKKRDIYGQGNRCDEFEFESEVQEKPEQGNLHLKRGDNDDQMTFDTETKVFEGNWKDLEDHPTVKVKSHKCDNDRKPVCDSITVVKKNKKND